MLEQTLGTDTVRTGTAIGRSVALLVALGLQFAMVLGLLWALPDDMVLAPALLSALAVPGLIGLVGIVAAILMLCHSRDHLIIDDEGISEVRFGSRRRVSWTEVEDVQTIGWAPRQSGAGPYCSRLRIVAGRHSVAVPLSGFRSVPGAAERFRLRLERFWQAKLTAMSRDLVWMSQTKAMLQMLGLMGLGVLPMLACVGLMLGDGSDELRSPAQWQFLFALPAVVLSAVYGALSLRRAAGPEHLVLGVKRVPLASIESIHVVRNGIGEVWRLRGPGVRASLAGGAEFPLLCMHLIRHCRNAVYTYDVRAPRGPMENAFLPLPPGATEDFLVAKDEKTADRAQWRWSFVVVAWAVAAGAGMISMQERGYYYDDLARIAERQSEHARKLTESRAIEGWLFRHKECWHATYTIDGVRHDTHVYKLSSAPPGVRADQPVTLHYWPTEPDQAWFGELEEPWMPPPPTLTGAKRAAGTAGLFLILAIGLTWNVRRRRGPQPSAARF